MHEYDIALKTFLRSGREALLAITSFAVDRWHNVELPEVRNLRLDLLGEAADGRLIHIELQSAHDADMALRMMEYCAAIYRKFGRFPEQLVLYVGEKPLRMKGSLSGSHFSFNCRIVDIRELDGDRLLESDQIGDNVIAVLARISDQRTVVKRILTRIASTEPGERSTALKGFTMLAGLRHLEEVIEQEANQMPLLDDIMDNKVLGREFKRGLAQGQEQGREQGREQGLHDGEMAVMLRQIERRFGSVPSSLKIRLDRMSRAEVEAVALRLLDARTLEDLLD